MHHQRLLRYGTLDPSALVRQRIAPGEPCSVDGCSTQVRAKGLCGAHYQRQITKGVVGPAALKLVPREGTCTTEGCTDPRHRKGLCQPHYRQVMGHKDTRTKEENRLRARERRSLELTNPGYVEIRDSDWERLVLRYQGCCAYCGVKPQRLTMDHVIPLTRGGRHAPPNILPACNKCNASKGAKFLSEWRLALRKKDVQRAA